MAEMSANVRIGSLLFLGKPISRTAGLYVAPNGLTGWFDSVDVRRTMVQFPQSNGDFDVPSTLDSRTVSLIGLAIASSSQELGHMGNQVTGVFGDGFSKQVVVEYAGLTTWANAGLASQTKFAPKRGGSVVADLQIQMWCADPRRYGDGHSFGPATTVSAFHYGNFPAIPVLTVTGTATGYTVAGPSGKLFTVTHAVASGHPHSIDMATGLLSIDGAVVVGAVSQGDTWAIPAGAQVPMTITPLSGSLTLAAAVSDTYI